MKVYHNKKRKERKTEMKKAGKFIALILLLVCVPCWTGATLSIYDTCGGLGIEHLEGVFEGDGMRLVTYSTPNDPTVTLILEEGTVELIAAAPTIGTLYLLDPFSYEIPGIPESSLKKLWSASIRCYNGNDVKVKVHKDYLYDGKYEGKVFRLTKVSGPSDEPPYWDFPGWTENNSSAD